MAIEFMPIGPLRPLPDPLARQAPAPREPAAAASKAAARPTDPGVPPVDSGRVAEIRKAVETGRYPVTPARVADALIAAGLLLRTSK